MDIRGSKLHNGLVNLGFEYELHPFVSIRLGYNSQYKATAGIGLNLGDLKLDYAYIPDFGTEMDVQHYISFGYSFNTSFTGEGREVVSEAAPKKLEDLEAQVVKDKADQIEGLTVINEEVFPVPQSDEDAGAEQY